MYELKVIICELPVILHVNIGLRTSWAWDSHAAFRAMREECVNAVSLITPLAHGEHSPYMHYSQKLHIEVLINQVRCRMM